jgi:hypothetical protein
LAISTEGGPPHVKLPDAHRDVLRAVAHQSKVICPKPNRWLELRISALGSKPGGML